MQLSHRTGQGRREEWALEMLLRSVTKVYNERGFGECCRRETGFTHKKQKRNKI